MRFVLCALCILSLVSCGDSSSGSSGGNDNTPPIAQDVTIDIKGLDSVTYNLVSHINDAETAKTNLIVEVVDSPRYSNSSGSGIVGGEFTENCPSDNNQTGKIVWNSNTEFFYEICDGSGYVGLVYFTYRVKDEQGDYSETKTVTMIDFID